MPLETLWEGAGDLTFTCRNAITPLADDVVGRDPTCTLAVLSGSGAEGRVSLLERSLGIDVVEEGDAGLGAHGSSYTLHSLAVPRLGGDLLIFSGSPAMAKGSSAAMLVTPDGAATPVDLPALPQGTTHNMACQVLHLMTDRTRCLQVQNPL